MRYYDVIKERIEKELQPSYYQVIDESFKHEGHIGAHVDGETHFAIIVVSDEFEGLTKIKRHKVIYNMIDDLMQKHIHAVSIITMTNKEKELKRSNNKVA